MLKTELLFEASPVYYRNYYARCRIVINCGGSRSGKTYSILQRLIVYAFENTGKVINIVRKTQTEMHSTVLKDFVDILVSMGIYDERYHNKTRNEFWVRGNLFRFVGMDKAMKKRGFGGHILYANECNGLTLEDWVQLKIRHSEQIFLDYNPSEYFWLDEHVIEKQKEGVDFDFIHSTYKDNYDFLPEWQIRDIEDLINIDDYYYNVYTKGNRVEAKGKIFTNYTLIDPEVYDAIEADETVYGIDWGYEHPMVLMEVKIAQEKVYERELFYEVRKYDDDLIAFMNEKEISQVKDMYADHAYPASIRKVANAGYNVRKANKDVQAGIRMQQGLKRHICKSSWNHIRQIKKYKWKQTADGQIIVGEPVKVDDDCQDAARYAEYTHMRLYVPNN